MSKNFDIDLKEMRNSHKYSVAITGIGIISPIGNDKNESWNNLVSGNSGISYLNSSDIPYNIGGKVKGEQELLDQIFSANKQKKTDRFIHLAVLAGNEAMKDAGFSLEFPNQRERFGVCLGVGIGGITTINQASIDLYNHGLKRISPFLIPKSISNQASGWLSMEWNLQGSISTFVNACSSSGDAVGHAFRMIRDGYVDYMLTGGSESCLIPLSLSAFGNMRALCDPKVYDKPEKACRPFDKKRSGFVMGEGAGILVLERMDLAIKRGANIYAQIVGFGTTSDAFHITAMHPEGRGAVKAIEMALSDAKINADRIGYINAHGTSTKMNDEIETKVLKKVFGAHVDPKNENHARISSTKSMTGHLLGAAGGTEISFTALALKNQILPPTINLENPDPNCDLDYIPNKAVYLNNNNIEYAISNSFGFGGGNSVIVLKKV